MARAARSLDPESSGAATIEMKTSFFQPGGQVDCRIQARGRVLHRSTTLFYCEGEIWNGDQLVAKAMGTFKTLKRLGIASRMKLASPVEAQSKTS
jgi:acyl-coenzyme A thioesterase PaaI-like protein